MSSHPPVPLELLQGIYSLLGDLRRDSVQSREVHGQTLKALRDMHSELEHIRTERQRVDRIERTLSQSIEDNRTNIIRLETMLEEIRGELK